ncbi:MAG TPA: hypothetical protein ENI27_09330 [bacterium]|nr:hypothetical protein [bacterium]
MHILPDHFQINFSPIANQDAIVTRPHYRISMLTSRLIRLEYDLKNIFEDRPSQVFWYDQPFLTIGNG